MSAAKRPRAERIEIVQGDSTRGFTPSPSPLSAPGRARDRIPSLAPRAQTNWAGDIDCGFSSVDGVEQYKRQRSEHEHREPGSQSR